LQTRGEESEAIKIKSEKLEAELRDLRLNKERELEEHRKRAIVLESVAAEAKEESLHLSSEKMKIAEGSKRAAFV
jgi:hypothetical protein